MSKYALVSTVDTIGDGFPCRCVMIFETEEAAIKHAVDLIVEYDDSVGVNSSGWSMDNEKWTDPEEFFEAWQDNLGPTEYLHVLPVLSVKSSIVQTERREDFSSTSELARIVTSAPEMFRIVQRLAMSGFIGESELRMMIEECRTIVQAVGLG